MLASSQFGSKFLREMVLAGGDDYELVFTASPAQRPAVAAASHRSQTPVSRIGQIQHEPSLRLRQSDGQFSPNTFASFDHFKS
jgi:thiamine-monophosphate kinase